jgi:hypothetical protein
MDVTFYVHSPMSADYVHKTAIARINEPTIRKVDLAKFDMLYQISRLPNLVGRVTFQLDVYDDDDYRFAYVVADWKERLK